MNNPCHVTRNHFGSNVTFLVNLAVLLLAVCSCKAGDLVANPTRHAQKYLSVMSEMEADVSQDVRALKTRDASEKEGLESKRSALLGALQSLAVARSNVGDAQGAVAAFDEEWRYREQFYGPKSIGDESADLFAIDNSHTVDAVEAIARAARSRQIVILNEAHHVPFDRLFAMHLARALRKEGFEYLACETFFIDDLHVLERGYVVENTGFYSHEPTFVKFLMDAKNDGWKFVSYEPSSDLRESGMAKNIMDRVFAVNPNAKIFIYAGYSHAKKLPVSHSDIDNSKLAAQLLRLTGIDPLTINQVTLFAQYISAQQERYYARAVRKLKGRKPAVLVGPDGSPIKLSIDDFAYDFEVVHPAYMDDAITGRPEWLSTDFAPHTVPKEIVPTKGRRVLYAYLRDAAPDGVPIDVVVLRPHGKVPKLMLPSGDFVFEYED